MGKLKDLTGQQFGSLIVLGYAGKNEHRQTLWLCRCENCGNEVTVCGTNIKKSKTCKHCCKKGKNHPLYGKRGTESPRYGKHHSEETKCKIRKSSVKEDKRKHDDSQYKEWAKDVKEQADYTCDICKKRGRKVMFTSPRRLALK